MPPTSGIVIGPYSKLSAICRDYDPCAAEVARLVGKMITAQLPALVVEHIGSTAVEGCAGKGIVDLMVLYSEGQLEAAKAALDALGFQRQTTRDPFPEDRPMRVGSLAYQDGVYQLHAHVISSASPEAAELRAFRDHLRADPALRAAYMARKREIIAGGITDSVDYAIAKGAFVKAVIDSMP
jgi:GrpB-like predicted nucleotidyltransferase (UPF0157 family)